MKDNKDYAKIYQIASILISKYGYMTQMVKQFTQYLNVEMWLLNTENPDYQLIRVTLNRVEDFKIYENRLDAYLKAFNKAYNRELKFLDIHISREPYFPSLEKYDHLILEDDYDAGIDVTGIYPELYEAVKDDADPDMEMEHFFQLVSSIRKQKEAKKPMLKLRRLMVNQIIMGICVIMYLISVLLIRNHSDSSVYVFLGADYGTFTKGLHQYWRLFTCAFLHGGILHLMSNMYSLYMIGTILEKMIGKKYYLMSLTVCILTASLTQDILSENTITVGISGGIYGLLIILMIDMLRKRITDFTSFIPLILVNLMINMLDNTAWIAHLGGLVGGLVMYFFLTQKDKRGPAVMICVMLLCLFIKYVTMKSITPIYAGTDMQVVKIWSDLGFERHAQNLMRVLYEVYEKFGG